MNSRHEIYEMLRHKREAAFREIERKKDLEHEQAKAAIHAQACALVWAGTPEEPADAIRHWYESGWLIAESLENALRKAAMHFVRSDGKAVITLTPDKPEASTSTTVESSRSNLRRAFIIPLLEKRGWSVLDWANEAGVSHATTQDYLDNKRRPYPSTRLKLAKALNVPVERLPR